MSLSEDSLSTSVQRKNVDVFDRDAETNKGYFDTKSVQLSCRLAIQRSPEAILATERCCNRCIVDVGCGGRLLHNSVLGYSSTKINGRP